MLPAYLVTCHQRSERLGQRSFTQTCVKRETRPIIVTDWIPFGSGGQPVLRGWNGIQNVRPPLPSDVAIVLSASLREARAYFKEGHIIDPNVSRTINDPYTHMNPDEWELDLLYDLGGW